MSSVVPSDPTPFVTGFPSVSTRIIYGQWIYTDGTGVATPPTIDYVGGPYYLTSTQTMMFAKTKTASVASAIGDSTAGVWWAEVIVFDDADLVGDVAVKINHSILPGGFITIAVPTGSTPLNVANALRVQGSPGGVVVIDSGGGTGGSTGGLDVQGVKNTVGSMIVQAGGTYNATTGVITFPVSGSGTLQDASVTTAKLADSAVTNVKVAAGISADKVINGTANKVYTAAEQIKIANVPADTNGALATLNSTVAAINSSGGAVLPTGLVVWQNASDATRRSVPTGGRLWIEDDLGTGQPPSWMISTDRFFSAV